MCLLQAWAWTLVFVTASGLSDELVLLEFGVLFEELEVEGSLPDRVTPGPN